jgi:hypothetical protein
MKTYFGFVLVFLMAGFAPIKAVGKWRVEEIAFISSVSYARPFNECSMMAVFTGPSGQTLTRPAFWDGGNTWKVRFAPTALGRWSYVTSCNDLTNSGLNNQRGSIECTPYSGNLEIYKHGFVGISQNKRNLSYSDGTPFLWMSEDHSFVDREQLDSCNMPGCTSQFKYIADLRKTQNFTIYNTVIWTLGNWVTKGVEPNIGYYKMMDRKFQYLSELGYVISTALGYHKDLGDSLPDKDNVEATKLIARYVEARYGAYPVIYYTCGEFNIPKSGGHVILFDRYWWGEVARAIEKENAYNHPVSVNYWQPQGTWFADQSYFDYWALQAYTLRDYQYYKYWYQYSSPKPIIDAWSGMDHNTAQSQDDQRRIAYLIMQSGGAGWGSITEGIWNNCWKKNDCGCCVDTWGGMPWFQTLKYAGATYMSIAYKFYTSLEWWKLVPRFDDSVWASFSDPLKSVISTDDNKTYVVYFYNNDLLTGTLKNMSTTNKYRAQWFNPRTGKFKLIAQSVVPVSGSWKVPEKLTAEDWILLVTERL